mgnify:CR=1 FL=1
MPKVTSGGRLPGTNLLGKFSRAGAMRDFLDFYAFRTTYFHLDDFGGDTINLDYYALAAAGAAGAVFATNVQNGTGVVRGSTGTDDNAATSLVGPIIFRGDNNAGMWARIKIDVVTGFSFEIGLIDAVPGSAGPGVSDVDTPAVTMADGALIHLDTDQTLTTAAFVTVGSTANQTVKATTLTGFTVPTAATFFDVAIQLIGNDAFLIVNGGVDQIAHANGISGNSAGHVEGGVSLAPWVYVRTRNTTAAMRRGCGA